MAFLFPDWQEASRSPYCSMSKPIRTSTLVKEELPGFYVFGLVPHSGPNKDHKYLYSVHVKRKAQAGTDEGQTLTSLTRFLP